MQKTYKLGISVFVVVIVIIIIVLTTAYMSKSKPERACPPNPDYELIEVDPGDAVASRYVVKSGDTLGSIALRYKQTDTLEQIIKRNKIKDPNKLSVGQELQILMGKISQTNVPSIPDK